MIKKKIIHKLNIFLILMFICVFFMSSFNVYALDNQSTVEYISIEDFISFNKDTNFSGGDGSKANPYLIKTSDDLAQLSVNVSHINESSVYTCRHMLMHTHMYTYLIKSYSSAQAHVWNHVSLPCLNYNSVITNEA